MNDTDDRHAHLHRELAYYRREYNDLGSRVLRLQEEQSRAFREARRSRTVAKLIREAYRIIDSAATPDEVGELMLEIVVENAVCDRVAILHRLPDSNRFIVTHALGFASEPAPVSLLISSVPTFYFTTAESKLEPLAYELTEVLRVPYILWSFDPGSGYAMIIGNHSEGNVTRPFETGDQELIEGTLSVYIDVMSRKKAEVEMQTAKAQADEANEIRSRFLATFSHELRTPLNSIIGFSELMKDSRAAPMETNSYINYSEHIYESSQHLLALINDILDYSKIDSGPVEIEARATNLIELVSDVVEEMQALSSVKDIRVSVNVVERLPAVQLDPRRMRQVLTNIVGNAIKFSPTGSTVSISIQKSPNEHGFIIEVADQGIGINESDLEKVFEPFFQAREPYVSGSAGTGLGLSISKALVEAHQGHISIRSTQGKGTTVSITLPESRVIGERSPRSG